MSSSRDGQGVVGSTKGQDDHDPSPTKVNDGHEASSQDGEEDLRGIISSYT